MNFNLEIDLSQAEKIFETVSDSIKNQSKSGNHLYLKIDFKTGNISDTNKKIEATSFTRISRLVDCILQDENISLSVKNKILNSYQIIANKYNEKKLNFFTRQIRNIQNIFNAIVYFLSGNRNYQICNSQDIITRAKEQIPFQQERELPVVLAKIVSQYLPILKKQSRLEIDESDDRLEGIMIALSQFAVAENYEGLATWFDLGKVSFTEIPAEIRDLVFEMVCPYMKNIDMRGILLTNAIFEKFKAVKILRINLYNNDLQPSTTTTLKKLYIHHDKYSINRMKEICPNDDEEIIIDRLSEKPSLFNQFSKILKSNSLHGHMRNCKLEQTKDGVFYKKTTFFLRVWVGKRR